MEYPDAKRVRVEAGLSDLPFEIIVHVLSFAGSTAHLKAVCRKFCYAIDSRITSMCIVNCSAFLTLDAIDAKLRRCINLRDLRLFRVTVTNYAAWTRLVGAINTCRKLERLICMPFVGSKTFQFVPTQLNVPRIELPRLYMKNRMRFEGMFDGEDQLLYIEYLSTDWAHPDDEMHAPWEAMKSRDTNLAETVSGGSLLHRFESQWFLIGNAKSLGQLHLPHELPLPVPLRTYSGSDLVVRTEMLRTPFSGPTSVRANCTTKPHVMGSVQQFDVPITVVKAMSGTTHDDIMAWDAMGVHALVYNTIYDHEGVPVWRSFQYRDIPLKKICVIVFPRELSLGELRSIVPNIRPASGHAVLVRVAPKWCASLRVCKLHPGVTLFPHMGDYEEI